MPEDLSVDRILDVLEGASGSLMCPTQYAMVLVHEVRRLRAEAVERKADYLAGLAFLRKEHDEEMRDAGRELRDMQADLTRAEDQLDHERTGW